VVAGVRCVVYVVQVPTIGTSKLPGPPKSSLMPETAAIGIARVLKRSSPRTTAARPASRPTGRKRDQAEYSVNTMGLSDIDNQLTSVYRISGGGDISVIALLRAPGEREFSSREQRLLRFFHCELGRLFGRALASPTEPSPDKLPRRLRQTLTCLLEGDSEKQLAARLSLSQATIHQYVTALYRHFDVRSRAQLLALIIKRVGRAGWTQLES
jgi:DNA-binding CsgD family transcriptional regulator